MTNEKGKPQNARVPIKQTTKTTESDGTKARVPHPPKVVIINTSATNSTDSGGKNE